MADHVLSVWMAGDEPPGGAAIRLCRVDQEGTLAEHPAGFDNSAFLVDGVPVEAEDCLTADGLMNRERNEAVGAQMWQRLALGGVGDALKGLLGRERVYLDIRSPDLLRLPWELLRFETANLFTSGTPLALGRPGRNAGFPAGVPPESGHPLRIMVVLGNRPDDERIRAQQELLIIEREVREHNAEVLLRTLHRPGPDEIETALTTFRPHVFHFIGHGSSDPGEQPQVYVYSSTGSSTSWDAGRIREVFAQAPPRLVILNACQTGSSALVQAFVEAGCIAVVAMMGDIEGAASEHFSARFYGSLLTGEPVDTAVTTARRSLSSIVTGDVDGRELEIRSNWALPRLTVHGDVATAVIMPYVHRRVASNWLLPDFVARWGQRRRAWTAMDGSLTADGTEARLTVLYGLPEQGKRALLKALAEARFRAGDTVLYVDLAGGDTGRWHDVLDAIATAAGRAGLDPAELRSVITAGGYSAPVIERFRAGLERLLPPGGDCLLVIVNGLSDWMVDEVNRTILPELCAPYLRSLPTSRVRLMITLRELPDEVPWGRRPVGWEPIEVGRFDNEEWPHAIRLFSEYWATRVPGQRDRIAFLAGAVQNEPFAASLHYLRSIAEQPR